MSFINELRRRKVFRVAAGYVIVAWVLIQVVETVFPAFGLDDAAFRLLVIALAIGLVPAVIVAWAYELTKDGLKPERKAGAPAEEHPVGSAASSMPIGAVARQPRIAIPLAAALLLAAGSIVTLWSELQGHRKARLELLPQIEQLIESADMVSAWDLALEAEQSLPDDPQLQELWQTLAVQINVETEPPGAEVSWRRYSPGNAEWATLGKTPLTNVRLPRAVLQSRFELPGYETAERNIESFNGTWRIQLAPGELPQGMVRVPESERWFLLTGYLAEPYIVKTFLADRTEVTNEDYFEFVDAGGYDNPEYWSEFEFHDGESALDFESVVDRFRDGTGRLGPATWEGGIYPDGTAQLPVSGISWYEAAAYARYRGKQLPSIYQWSSMTVVPPFEEFDALPSERPGLGPFRSEFVALSNYSGDGLSPVGQHPAYAPFGTLDAAGNVREWIWNATADAPDAKRYILGGSWQDPSYLHTYGVAESPWDRSPTNGVRLVDYAPDEHTQSQLAPRPQPEQETIEPVSDEIFAIYRDLFDYDPAPLNARVESTDTEPTHWIHETISFDATYDDERVLLNLFIPRNIEPPYQTVVYFPSSEAVVRTSSEDLQLGFVDFIIKSGRALAFPVLNHTYERFSGLETTWPQDTREYSEQVVQWIQDVRRSVDYLETRDELDLSKLGFYGLSWGGWNGPIVMALDERFITGVYVSGGIPPTLARPEASSASYAARVTQPVLMISGKDDMLRPVETYMNPMFESLGTPDHLKHHAILEGGHKPEPGPTYREALAWFDRYLGEVE